MLTLPPLPDPDEIQRMGATACLAKPVRMMALKEALRTALGKPRPRSPKTNSQETPRPTITTPTSIPRPDVAQPRGAPQGGQPKTVLLVEDNVINQQVACRMLEILGYQVCVAVNGFEALERLQTQPPDAILMDCHLPEMDGYTATQRIREQERTLGRHVPIIALTANALAGERDRCLAAGMDDYLAKPFRMKDLEEVMQRVLGAASQPTPAAQLEHRTGEIPTENAESEAALLDADAFWIGTGITPGSHGAQQLAQQIIATFQSDVADQMQELRAAMERQDAKEVRAIAHRLYGSAAQLGARRLARALKRLEKAPDASTWAAQLRVVEEVSAATSRAFDEALQRKALVQTPHGWPHG